MNLYEILNTEIPPKILYPLLVISILIFCYKMKKLFEERENNENWD